MREFLIGADPELFVQQTGLYHGDGKPSLVSAHDLMPGTKTEPVRVDFGAVQVDGVAAEFNIDPAKTALEFSLFRDAVVAQMSEMINQGGDSYHLIAQPTAYFDQEYFDSLPEEVKRLGCTPDYNAWTGKANEPPSTDEPFRTGGGHLHVGWGNFFDDSSKTNDHWYDCLDAVQQLDLILFPISHLWDKDQKRRELYGNAGAFRSKQYGVEYRPLSNAWVGNERIEKWLFDTIQRSMHLLFNEGEFFSEDRICVEFLEKKEFSDDDLHGYLWYMSHKYGTPMLIL